MPFHVTDLRMFNFFTQLEAHVTCFDGISTLEDALLSHWGFYLARVDLLGLSLT